MEKIAVSIKKPEPTIGLLLSDGHRIDLSREDFVKLHNEMTKLYNDNYELIEKNDD